MGAGKSTVGEVLARQLSVNFVDLDAWIESDERRSISDIFRSDGEAAFRSLEQQAMRRLLDELPGGVMALGGGTVSNENSRRLALQRGLLVGLNAPVGTLTERVRGSSHRPLLRDGDPQRTLQELVCERAAAYAECHVAIDTAGRSPADIAVEIAAHIAAPPIVVPLGLRTYRVQVGAGVRRQLADFEAPTHGNSVALLVSDHQVARHWGSEVSGLLAQSGWKVVEASFAAGETHKNLASLELIWDRALQAGVDRRGMVVGLGGGVAGDLAGFAASTLLRGIDLLQLPTSLLAMVDSSVGGKTGIDRPQGKNLVGTFHQPLRVLCDVEFLSTLPQAERVSGLAEVAKSAWLAGEAAVRMLEDDAEQLVAGDPGATERAIRMAVALKARIVADDETETGARRLLNLGHTFGHAIEAAAAYRGLRHGEAVALGMLAAFRVSRGLGIEVDLAAFRLTELLRRLGLPTDWEAHWSEASWPFLQSDKKRSGAALQFVVPAAPGATTVQAVTLEQLRAWIAK